MPHILVDRVRFDLFTCMLPKRKESSIGAVAIEVLDVVAALCCLVGSACLTPELSGSVTVFLRGCAFFICGSMLFALACGLAFANSWMELGLGSREARQSAFYLTAALVYLAGTFLYWPSSWQTGSISPAEWLETEYETSAASKSCASWPQRANLHDQAFAGSTCCIVGALMLSAAAFANMLLQQTGNDCVSKLLIAIASFYMLGSLLLALSAVAFLPRVSCGVEMATVGSGLAIIGSCFYLIGGMLSVVRTALILNSPGDGVYRKAYLAERDPLIAYRSDPVAAAGPGASAGGTRSLPASAGSLSGGPAVVLGGTYRSLVPVSVGVPPA